MDTEKIDLLLASHLANETSKMEEALVQQWIFEHPVEYLSLKILWIEADETQDTELFNLNMAWEKVESRISKPECFYGNLNQKRWRCLVTAVILLLIAALLLFIYNC